MCSLRGINRDERQQSEHAAREQERGIGFDNVPCSCALGPCGYATVYVLKRHHFLTLALQNALGSDSWQLIIILSH